MSSDLERLAARLAALGKRAEDLRTFVQAATTEQHALMGLLHQIGARHPEARTAASAVQASLSAANDLDKNLAATSAAATHFVSRILGSGPMRRGPAMPPGQSAAPRAGAPGPGGVSGPQAASRGADDGPAPRPGGERAPGGGARQRLDRTGREDGRPVPEWVARLAATLEYPDTGQTVGRLASSDGAPVGEQIWSGRAGPGQQLADLRTDLPNRVHLWKPVREHVEGHAAAAMRGLGGVQHMVLVVSRPPCPDRQGCDVALPHILRKGSTLTVYVAEDGHPPRYFDTYVGTGRAVKP